MNRVFAFLTTLAAACLLTGCAGYQIGNQSLYAANIQTIYVPMVKAPAISPHLSDRITEAVAKEIEVLTPYKLTQDNYADAVLNIEIVEYKQGINFKDRWGGPRQDNLEMTAKVELVNRRSLTPECACEFSLDQEGIVLGHGSMIPVAGQSTATEQQEAIDRLARRIVNSLEKPW
ncbi:MAG: LptE family protein [Thermoguttaceae bacterium]|nr:LptE family protein [Thermoguttaceae bacterium]